jgi:hypothetical protein
MYCAERRVTHALLITSRRPPIVLGKTMPTVNGQSGQGRDKGFDALPACDVTDG